MVVVPLATVAPALYLVSSSHLIQGQGYLMRRCYHQGRASGSHAGASRTCSRMRRNLHAVEPTYTSHVSKTIHRAFPLYICLITQYAVVRVCSPVVVLHQ